MKKIVFFIFITLSTFARAQHLDFMGIPLNGSIEVFESEIINKGFYKSQSTSNYYKRMYDNMGDDLLVYCNSDNRVMQCTLIRYLFDSSKNETIKEFHLIKKSLMENYKGNYRVVEDNADSFVIFIDDIELLDCLGIICIEILQDDDGENYIVINYGDRINTNNFNNLR